MKIFYTALEVFSCPNTPKSEGKEDENGEEGGPIVRGMDQCQKKYASRMSAKDSPPISTVTLNSVWSIVQQIYFQLIFVKKYKMQHCTNVAHSGENI